MLGNRILSMTLRNIKNVAYGHFEFPENSLYEKGVFGQTQSGILGFYGQNGSGKTTVVAALSILKSLAMGWNLVEFLDGKRRVKKELNYLLSLGAEAGSVTFEFLLNVDAKLYKVLYEFELKREGDGQTFIAQELFRVFPRHDKGITFKYPFAPVVIDYAKPYVSSLYDGVQHEEGTKIELPSRDSNEYQTMVQLSAQKELCHSMQLSLLFSKILREYLRGHRKEDVQEVGAVLDEFHRQLSFNLFVFSSRLTATAYFDQSLVSSIYHDESSGLETHGMFLLSDEPFVIRRESLPAYQNTVQNVNSFISTFVPGFSLEIECLSREADATGQEKIKVDIYRAMGKERLPLSQESAGIKRMISLCAALSYAYGEPSAWIVIDEMDSGVFENLWGQIIELLSDEGKGQVLFTAHNLAPLERVAASSLVFTTQNPENRYIRFKNVKKTNNLRDLYLRALRLGGQEEELASDVDTQDLGVAFYNAFRNGKDWRNPNA